MEPKFSFRNGNLSDLVQIKDLTILAYMQFRNVLSKENAQAWELNLSNEDTYTDLLNTAFCFVCETGDKIIGVAFLIPHGNPYKWFEADWSYIRLVGVHPDFERKGIGKKLTKLCIEKAKATGEKTLALHTSEFQSVARHIYESMGFKKLRPLDPIFGKQYYLYTLQLH